MRTTLTILLAAVLLTACSASRPPASESKPHGDGQTTSVEFAPPAKSGKQPAGITYDTALVPTGATAVVSTSTTGGRTQVRLSVKKLRPDHKFGAHVHTRPCGAKPADAGPHYQNRKDPVSPSVDPAFANPENEVWLDFVTDAKGNGDAVAVLDWTFRPGGAHSVVIHAQPTSTHAGHAGTAGERLACIAVAAF